MRPKIKAELEAPKKAAAAAEKAAAEAAAAAAAAAAEASAGVSTALPGLEAGDAPPPPPPPPPPPAKKAKEEGPSLAEIGRICGERWKEASEDERMKYELIAEADKERYDIEMRQHKAEIEAREAAAMKGKRGSKKAKMEKEAAAAAAAAGGAEASNTPNGEGGGTPEAGQKRRRSEGPRAVLRVARRRSRCFQWRISSFI